MIKKEVFSITSINQADNLISKGLIIVPNINLLARELTSKSQVQILLTRLLNLNFYKVFLLLINNLSSLNKIINKNFAFGIKLLCEIDILCSDSKQFLLHNQVTDMSIAFKNKEILQNYFKLAKQYNFAPRVLSYNIGPLINFLSEFENIPENLIIYTPLNKKDYLTNPSYKDIYEYLRNTFIEVVPMKV